MKRLPTLVVLFSGLLLPEMVVPGLLDAKPVAVSRDELAMT